MGGDPIKRRPLTRIGTLLGSATIALMLCGTALYLSAILDDLPQGNYPLVLILLPMLAGGALFFGITSLVLERLGVPVFRKAEASEEGKAKPKAGGESQFSP